MNQPPIHRIARPNLPDDCSEVIIKDDCGRVYGAWFEGGTFNSAIDGRNVMNVPPNEVVAWIYVKDLNINWED